jgi:serine/threonine protein kinase
LNGKGSSSKHRPASLGPFAVRADLGAGRFGPVYLGRDPSTNARVVIRTFELSREQRELVEPIDLLDSFRKLCETPLDHPGLARPLAFGVEGDLPYVVYSELAGTAMDAVMRQHGVRPVAEVLQRASQLAEAIDCAASSGIHHGMMAPCEVMLDGDRTGVTGFGLAQALIRAGMAAEAVSPYGSPQRVAGAPPTHVDDIYSLAAITLELLIGTPRDPEQETSRALRQAQGLPERRRLPRPAPHETRLFTTIPGIDAGKLRAAFAAAFSEEPSERLSKASEFVARLRDAIAKKRDIDEPAPGAVVVALPSDEEEPSSGVANKKPAENIAAVELPIRQEPVVVEKPESEPETRVIRLEPIVDDALLEEVTPPRASSLALVSTKSPAGEGDLSPNEKPVQPVSRAFVAAAVVTISFAAGFGGGFVAGHFSKPSAESMTVSHHEPVAEPQPMRAAVEKPQPTAPPTQAVAPIPEQTVARASEETVSNAAPVAVGRLSIRSTPAGAGVVVDGQSRGVTPLALRDLAFGAHTIEVSHPGHDSRQRRVTLSERRPARSLNFALRPASVTPPATASKEPAQASAPATTTATKTTTGSLQVASRPSGAQVFVDDELIGTTPLLLSDIAAGSKRLRVELSGYTIWTRSVQIEPSARSRVMATLEP